MSTIASLATCIAIAASTFSLPEPALYALRYKEGGRLGLESRNTNGTVDYGPFQINSLWIGEFTQRWQTAGREETIALLRDDNCANAHAAAWILRQHLDRTNSLSTAIEHYHSRTPAKGKPYGASVSRFISAIE